MLQIQNLNVSLAATSEQILFDINLEITPGEVHYLMGRNGSGKSTLAKVLAGHPDYSIDSGSIIIDGIDVTDLDATTRARMGLFLAFQYPAELPGVKLSDFLRLACNSRREDKLPVFKFRKLLREVAAKLNYSEALLERNVNEGFSGGEKKKTEILQMAVLEPSYALLDETDSGLDVDALKDVFLGINKLLAENTKPPGVLIITHYHRVVEYVNPQFVHVMKDGRISETGDINLAKRIDTEGYN